MLYLTGLPEGFARRLQAVRFALDYITPGSKHSPSDADAIIRAFEKSGAAELGSVEDMTDEELTKLRDKLEELGCETSTEKPTGYQVPLMVLTVNNANFEREVTNAIDFSDQASDVATWMLAQKEGNPLQAAAVLVGLFRLTRDDLYSEAIDNLSHVFPWLPAMLKTQGLWPETEWEHHA